MIPYNPSSFNSNKTILEQILELKRWLQAHPSYEVFYSSENGQSTAYTGYLLSSISDPTNLAVGDIVVFDNATFGVVTSVDTDNGEFGCDPCISLVGPEGPEGPQGVSISNVTINASNHLICTLSNGTSIDAGVIQYGTYFSISGSSGTLTDDEYAKALLNDTKIIETIGTSTLIYTKYGESSSEISYTILVPLDVYPSPTTTTQNITINKSTHAWTRTAYKIPIGIDNIKSGAYSVNRCVKSDGDGGSYWGFIEGTEVKSTGATSGKVLQADGSGGASWQNAGGGISRKYMHCIRCKQSGTIKLNLAMTLFLDISTPITDKTSLINAIVNSYAQTDDTDVSRSSGVQLSGMINEAGTVYMAVALVYDYVQQKPYISFLDLSTGGAFSNTLENYTIATINDFVVTL